MTVHHRCIKPKNVLVWLCVDDKASKPHATASAMQIRQLINLLASFNYIERRIYVRRLYNHRDTVLMSLISLCDARQCETHEYSPIQSMANVAIRWLLSPYEAKSC
ncbi:hypothetical protein [Pseudoalteromonas maricaloris]|uniref:hypothetical protein n=1 Tax=Pseudoalteromonas maricaloris TaxID=184924 RepID=UPI0012FDE7CF|nr:hypothetical protein [Pseudoalteromonas flavipulchra]